VKAALVFVALTACSGKDIVLGDGQPEAEPTFGEPVLVSGIALGEDEEGDDDDPTLASAVNLLLFNSNRAGNEDVFAVTLSSDGDALTAPEPVSELNTEERETGLAVSADGLELWFSSDRLEEDDLAIFHVSRAAVDEAWSEPELVVELSTEGDDLVSSVSSDLLELWLARRADADADYALYVTRREDSGAAWETPRALPELDGDGPESDAFPLDSGLGLAFTRDEDLMLATRTELGAVFRAALPLTELNSSDDDRDLWASSGLDRVLFSSDRSGQYRLYRAERR
jgi:hypothetical protein